MEINDILNKRGVLVKDMRELVDVAEKEGRDLNEEEQTKFEAMDKDQTELKNRADRILRQNEIEAEANELLEVKNLEIAEENSVTKGKFANKEYANAFDQYVRKGGAALDHQYANALQIGTDSEGGYITPQEYETRLTVALEEFNVLRGVVDVMPTSSDRNIPVEATRGVATWTAEEAAYTQSDPAFSQVVLGAHKLGRIVKVSEELLQDAFFNVESYLAENFGRAFGEAEEAAFANGDGSGKPTGIVQGSTLGVSAAGAAAITSDELIDLYHALKRPYRARAWWLMKDDSAKLIRKLKDGDNQYLWQPGLQAGEPDTILGRPVAISDGMPAPTTGNKSVVFGDMSFYRVADRSGKVMQRLNELYAANGQVGFRMFMRVDGKVTLAEAFQHLIQA